MPVFPIYLIIQIYYEKILRIETNKINFIKKLLNLRSYTYLKHFQ